MRRINKDDCRNAAKKLSDIAFDKKIEEINEEFKVIMTNAPKETMENQWYNDPYLRDTKRLYSETFNSSIKRIFRLVYRQERYYSSSFRTSKILFGYNLCSI